MPVIHMNTEEASIITTLKSLVSDQTQIDKPKIVISYSGLHKIQIISRETKHNNTGAIFEVVVQIKHKKVKKNQVDILLSPFLI